MRLYYQVYADKLPVGVTFTEIFNRLWAAGGRFSQVRITARQMRLLLEDSEDPSKHTEIKLGLSGLSTNHPSFIQVSAATPVRANELFRRLIQGDGSEGINVYGTEEVEGDAEPASL